MGKIKKTYISPLVNILSETEFNKKHKAKISGIELFTERVEINYCCDITDDSTIYYFVKEDTTQDDIERQFYKDFKSRKPELISTYYKGCEYY